ncbi:uncharacterized protein LOC122958386 [Acropora millepora]|uniref:uncharacterized protein LOC122958386 n=1 Tax=Acropora millepora TaxID=45264 RepID=UPI001CF250C5|nr:uncharacterized protein LOC122958386 [Acropora millepora]
MLALPPDEHQLLSRLSQYLCYRGIIPVVVRSPSEALIHSRHSRFAAIILPENDPVLIRKVRSLEGMNYGTPVVVISSAEILPDSTLEMLSANEIQEAVHRTTNSEKFEADLICALNHVLGQSCHYGDPAEYVSLMSYPVQTTWSSVPHCSFSATPSTSFHHQLAGPSTISHPCVINYGPNEIQNMSIQAGYAVKPSAGGSQIYEQHLVPISKPQLMDAGEQSETKECASDHESMTQVGDQLPAAGMGQSLSETSHENTESLLPGIETLLNAIQVVEGENNSRNNPADATFTGITALHIPEETRSSKRPRSKRTRRPSAAAAGLQKRTKTVTSETDLESLSDSKSPMPASLSGKQPYFLEFESFREPLADDPLANPVDRHNSKERHRRIRITKAAEFFKAVIPGMNPKMDKATAFHITVQYIIFLRNELLKFDPPILPKLHQSFIEEWGEVFNLKDESKADGAE